MKKSNPTPGKWKEIVIQKDICTQMFVAALFTEAKTWKEPKCPFNRGVDKEDVIHKYKGILFNHKNETMPFPATWMDLEIIILSEVSRIEKDRYHMILFTCRIFKNMIQMNFLTETDSGLENLWLPAGKGGE